MFELLIKMYYCFLYYIQCIKYYFIVIKYNIKNYNKVICNCCDKELDKNDIYKFKDYKLCYICHGYTIKNFDEKMYNIMTKEEYLHDNIICPFYFGKFRNDNEIYN